MPRATFRIPAALLVLLAAACGDDNRPDALDSGAGGGGDVGTTPVDVGLTRDTGAAADAGADVDAGEDAGFQVCDRSPSAPDGMRTLILSHPSPAGGGFSNRYRAVAVTEEGELVLPGMEFEMGRAVSGHVVFTPDGEIGLVPQELGSIGVFRVTAPGQVEVIDPAFEPSFPTGEIVMHPDGNRAWVLGVAFRTSGGGIYEIEIGCDGRLRELGKLVAAKLPWVGTFLPHGGFLLGGEDVGDSALGDDAHLLEIDPLNVLAGADAFGNMAERDAIPSAIDVTSDGRYGIVTENSFSSPGHRVAMVRIEASSVVATQLFWPSEECAGVEEPPCFNDPAGVMASPHDDMVLVSAADGSNAIYRFDYDPENAEAPFTFVGEIDYSETGPLLPVEMVAIERGSLTGLVFVSEVSQVRRLRFEGGGVVSDLGVDAFGGDGENNIGAIGITP